MEKLVPLRLTDSSEDAGVEDCWILVGMPLLSERKRDSVSFDCMVPVNQHGQLTRNL